MSELHWKLEKSENYTQVISTYNFTRHTTSSASRKQVAETNTALKLLVRQFAAYAHNMNKYEQI